MSLIPWGDVLNPNVATGNPLLPLANAARQGMCQYRQAYPLAFTNPLSSISPGSRLIQRFNDAVWDRVCPESEYQPPPIDTPFYGGQCPTFYRLLGVVNLSNGQRASDLISFVRGPLADAGMRYQENSPTSASVLMFVVDVNGQLTEDFVFTGRPFQIVDYSLEITREDGLPDDCGDRPIPPVIINIPPPTSLPVTVNLGDQITTLDITPTNLTINPDNSFEFSPEFSLGDVNFRPTIEGIDIDLEPTLALAPEVDVDLDVGGVGGALGTVLEVLPTAIQLLTEILDLIEDGGGGSCDLQPLADYLECLIEKPNAEVDAEPLIADSAGGSYPLISGCFAVQITAATPFTPGTKMQAGSGTNDGIFFWGWASAGRGSSFATRQPLNYQRQIIFIPPYADTVLINPTFANRFSAVQFIESNSCQYTPPEDK